MYWRPLPMGPPPPKKNGQYIFAAAWEAKQGAAKHVRVWARQ
jgi:hypothetical protein